MLVHNDCELISSHISEYYILVKLRINKHTFDVVNVYIPPSTSKYAPCEYSTCLDDIMEKVAT